MSQLSSFKSEYDNCSFSKVALSNFSTVFKSLLKLLPRSHFDFGWWSNIDKFIS
jgi:hypothetical protein